ncbi:alcohol dehydrogenase (Zinc) [marine actinobacterium PHSC20C1]|nr:alcohol dehydrogenase (Zinc) [marine actinobacterium PHSC20C1]
MQAALLLTHGLNGLAIREVDVPVPGEGEVRIRVETVGANQLDLNVISGLGPGAAAKLPRVLGLDPAGVIDAVGEGVDPSRVGEPVVVKPNIPCGTCAQCLAQREADCPRQSVVGVHRDGGAAEYITVPSRSAFARGTISAAHATAAMHSLPIVINAIDVAEVTSADRVLVTGASGTLGQMAVEYLRHLGADVVAASRKPLEMASDVLTVECETPGVLADPARLGGAVNVVIDVTGHAPTLAAAISGLAWGGRAVFCSASVDTNLTIDARAFYLGRKRLAGVASADYSQVERALQLVASGAVVPPIGSRYALTDIRRAYQGFAESLPGKVVIDVV